MAGVADASALQPQAPHADTAEEEEEHSATEILQSVKQEQQKALERLRIVRGQLAACNGSLAGVLQLLRVAGRHAAADMHAMRSDLDAAYAALRLVQQRRSGSSTAEPAGR